MARARIGALELLLTGPANRNAVPNRMRLLWVSAALPALVSGSAWPAKWDIVPTLSAAEIYTDNVSLAPDTLKRSDWVTQIIPGISIAAKGTGLRFKASYTPELIYYSQGEGDNQVFHQFTATGTAELAKQLLFVDAGALQGQENVSLQEPLTNSNIYTTGNRATVGTYYVSPYLRRAFGSEVIGEARYTYSLWNSDDPASNLDNTANRVSLRAASGLAYKLFTWNLNFERETVDYESQQDTNTEVIVANARRLIMPTVGLLAQAGYEKYESGVAGLEEKGPGWSAGFDWTPTPRTRLAATMGRRFFGRTYDADFRHRTRLTAWSASYTEGISSTRKESFNTAATSTSGYLAPLFLSSIPDPEARQKAVDELIAQRWLPPSLNAPDNFFSGQLFLVKRGQAAVSLLGSRNVVIANAYRENREALFGNAGLPNTGDFAASNTVNESGTSLAWSWRLTTQDTWILRGALTRYEFPDIARVDDKRESQVGLIRQLQPRVSGSLSYRWQQNDSNDTTANYTEHSVVATLQMRF